MAPVGGDDRDRLNEWLAMLSGQGREARDKAVAEMRAAGAGRLFPLLAPMSNDPDPEVRCFAREALL